MCLFSRIYILWHRDCNIFTLQIECKVEIRSKNSSIPHLTETDISITTLLKNSNRTLQYVFLIDHNLHNIINIFLINTFVCKTHCIICVK